MENKMGSMGMKLTDTLVLAGLALTLAAGVAYAHGADEGNDESHQMMDRMREMHRGHHHKHDFEALKGMTPRRMRSIMGFMRGIGIAVPEMDSRRGRKLFLAKGCVVCHQVNGVGGDVGPSLDAAEMPKPMNAFEFAARMWRGAPAMIAMQKDQLGEVISLSGKELADLIAFAHDETEQKRLKAGQIPKRYRVMLDGQ